MKPYIGIDNGVSGAAAYISPDGLLIDWIAMPIQKARKGNEIDVVALWAWLRKVTGDRPATPTYIVEEPGGSKSAKAACSMAGSFHALRAMLAMESCIMHRVTPQSWQRHMLPGAKAGDTKPRALEFARRLWPAERWLETERCTRPHDGAIDAALIAEWGRRTAL